MMRIVLFPLLDLVLHQGKQHIVLHVIISTFFLYHVKQRAFRLQQERLRHDKRIVATCGKLILVSVGFNGVWCHHREQRRDW